MKPRKLRLFSVALLAASLFTATSRALAASGDGTPDRTRAGAAAEAAREEFRQASQLVLSGHHAEALTHYQSSYEHFQHATTLLNIGYCRESLGDIAGALRALLRAVALSEQRPERALNRERAEQAARDVRAFGERVARLRFEPGADTVEVCVDGAGFDTGEPGSHAARFADETPGRCSALTASTELVVNPGTHTVVWSAPAGTRSETVEVVSGQALSLRAAPLSPQAPNESTPAASAAQSREPAAAVPNGPRSESAAPARSETARTAATASLLVAGTALGTGLVAGALALHAKRELDDACVADGACPRSQEAPLQRFSTATTTANVAFAIAGVAALAGVTLLVIDVSGKPASAPRAARPSLRLRLSSRLEFDGSF